MSKLGQEMFRRTVVEMGGEILPGFVDARCADFLFRPRGMIVDMKILDEQVRDEHAVKVEALTNNRIRRGVRAMHGKELLTCRNYLPITSRSGSTFSRGPP